MKVKNLDFTCLMTHLNNTPFALTMEQRTRGHFPEEIVFPGETVRTDSILLNSGVVYSDALCLGFCTFDTSYEAFDYFVGSFIETLRTNPQYMDDEDTISECVIHSEDGGLLHFKITRQA